METIPQSVVEEIRRRELSGRYYKAGRTSVFHLLEDLDKLLLKSYHSE